MNEVCRILCVDDEPQILRVLAASFRAQGYVVDLATSGEEALRSAVAHRPDVVVLDLVLPGMSGIEVIEVLRGWSQVPIVVVSARDAETDRIAALDAGADDFVGKPFAMGELLARLRAARRRGPSSLEVATLTTDDFTIDFANKRVTTSEGSAKLTPTEWHLVEVLARNAGKLVTGRSLLQQVWGPKYGAETNYLRVHIAHIRRKLEPVPGQPRYFLTEPGVGYRFERPPQSTW